MVEGDDGVAPEVLRRENRVMMGFIVVAAVVFGMLLGSHFWSESIKNFEYANISWQVEEYAEPMGSIYHGRFASLTIDDLFYNIYLRNDPRENVVGVDGRLDDFQSIGYVAWDEEINGCKGELSRAMYDLTAFLKQGVGVRSVGGAASSLEYANSSGMEYVDCDIEDRTIVIIGFGDESKVVKDKENKVCYTIYVEDCEDVLGIEKFMTQAVEDWNS